MLANFAQFSLRNASQGIVIGDTPTIGGDSVVENILRLR
jgi:hypothetical protein